MRLAWDHLHVVPSTSAASTGPPALAREQPVRLTSAIHLAAAERMPAPVRFVTFDPGQIGVALGLGLDVGVQLRSVGRRTRRTRPRPDANDSDLGQLRRVTPSSAGDQLLRHPLVHRPTHRARSGDARHAGEDDRAFV